ncbi:MAG TPA: hypothetical protein VGX68_17905 [Thermoanaerobaculia bacterium]|jgi:hypothetical protein|nr:hypothetical protein [Thermoanaerobaculia bacterium]
MKADALADSPVEGELADRHDHPKPEQLERFMRGEVSPAENRAVVNHLLTRCPQCRYITSRLWKLGRERRISTQALLHRELRRLSQQAPSKPTRREAAVAALVKAAQEMVLEAAKELTEIYGRLEVMVAALPPSPQPDAELDDVLTELRCVVRTVLAEYLRLAADDLRAVGLYPAEPPDEEDPPSR